MKSTRNSKEPKTFRITAIPKTITADEPSLRPVMERKDRKVWERQMKRNWIRSSTWDVES